MTRGLRFRARISILYLYLCLAAVALSASPLQVPLGRSSSQQKSDDKLGAVASENKICSQIGINLLKAGGNAVDALVGTVLCVGVVDGHHSGLGGGGFALVRSNNGSYESVDFRETAPASAYQDMFKGNLNGSFIGGLSVCVPGEPQGLYYIHNRYGILSWSSVLQPAIDLARNGFVISSDFAKAMDIGIKIYGFDFFAEDPAWAMDFAPNGSRVGEGDIITRKRYAFLLETIAAQGPEAFYKGPLANTTVQAVRNNNGTMTMDDMENFKIVSRKPVKVDYRGFHLYGSGVPASSSVALSVLKILEGYQVWSPHEPLSIHRLDEAIRFGYGKRASFGDPDFVVGMELLEAAMLNHTYASETRARISDKHTLGISDYDPEGFEILDNHGTSQVVVADALGMAVSLTTTVNLFFGSRLMVPETGVILNDEMADFSIPHVSNVFGYYPSPSNYIRPNKRSMSSITPIIAELANGTLFAILGASGGSRIITTVIQTALNVLDHGMSVHDAVKQRRLHDQLLPNQITFEPDYNDETLEFMRGRGHNVTLGPVGSSSQAIKIEDGRFEAAGEPRQKNSAGLTA